MISQKIKFVLYNRLITLLFSTFVLFILLKFQIFEKLLETQSNDIFKKLIPIAGEISEDNLGLSEGDKKILIDDVNIIIHSAATLDFQQNLRPTVNINLLGTRRVMTLCKEIKNIVVIG